MTDLPVNIDSTYADDPGDSTVALHQQHHDAIHALYNAIAGATPDLRSLGIGTEPVLIGDDAEYLWDTYYSLGLSPDPLDVNWDTAKSHVVMGYWVNDWRTQLVLMHYDGGNALWTGIDTAGYTIRIGGSYVGSRFGSDSTFSGIVMNPTSASGSLRLGSRVNSFNDLTTRHRVAGRITVNSNLTSFSVGWLYDLTGSTNRSITITETTDNGIISSGGYSSIETGLFFDAIATGTATLSILAGANITLSGDTTVRPGEIVRVMRIADKTWKAYRFGQVLTAADIRALGFFDTTNDGTGSGLDADLLDGQHAAAFATSGHNHDSAYADIDGEYAVNTVAASGATETLTLAPAHKVTMDQSCTFTFPTPTAGHTFLLLLSGAFTPTFPASVDWDSATAPTYATPSLYGFTTLDGGTTWLGTLIASGLG